MGDAIQTAQKEAALRKAIINPYLKDPKNKIKLTDSSRSTLKRLGPASRSTWYIRVSWLYMLRMVLQRLRATIEDEETGLPEWMNSIQADQQGRHLS